MLHISLVSAHALILECALIATALAQPSAVARGTIILSVRVSLLAFSFVIAL